MLNTPQGSDRHPQAPASGSVNEEEGEVLDVDNDPGNEDPGSQFDRDATVPLIEPDEPGNPTSVIDKENA